MSGSPTDLYFKLSQLIRDFSGFLYAAPAHKATTEAITI